jgi:dynein heavy chain
MCEQVSNQVISRCKAHIDLDKLFNGFITSSRKSINECITCCESWREIYQKVGHACIVL